MNGMSYWATPGGRPQLKKPNPWFPHASGIALDIVGREDAPVTHVDISAITVAGITGQVTVWTAPDGWSGKLDQEEAWKCIYQQSHPRGWPNHAAPSKVPSVTLNLNEPIILKAGAVVGLYVHTTGWGGMVARAPAHYSAMVSHVETPRGRVLPSMQASGTHSADHLIIRPGCAKTWSPSPFGEVLQWTLQRELNGFVVYQPRWLLWSPQNDRRFPTAFRRAAAEAREAASLPDVIMTEILGYCRPGWFDQAQGQVNLKLPVQST